MGLLDKAAAVQEPARADYIAGLKGSRQNKVDQDHCAKLVDSIAQELG